MVGVGSMIAGICFSTIFGICLSTISGICLYVAIGIFFSWIAVIYPLVIAANCLLKRMISISLSLAYLAFF